MLKWSLIKISLWPSKMKSANGKNKLTIVIPCHRVIGANGKLTGYAGRLWRKEWLLRHEKKHKENSKN